MSVEALTYTALGARLKVSPQAARSLARRRRWPRSLSDEGKALVSVDLAELRYTPRPRRGRPAGEVAAFAAAIETLNAQIVQLEARAAGERADFERECERSACLQAELLRLTAETMAAKEATARLEDEVAALRVGGSVNNPGQGARRLGHLAAAIVDADRKACR